ncbi:golgin subfamily A member 4 [Copidosoma floridanum]|uniref:golgin subfamily A member 4 n=1 Tax=Copidosoma floridanum TaxID=29053 RepID=UPI0006C9742B|nr:golgin subfamily A member 4 [Copidosoma floridanum]
MFKKFKDKLTEEMKQSPARLHASMQQLAQAVSPSLSNSSFQDLSLSRDNFSLSDQADEIPKNSPEKHDFQTVDLTSPPVISSTSRRSSVSSNVSDRSFLFSTYESPGVVYHTQSDMDQSASDIDESISSQLDRVSKEQLYTAYRKAKCKYDKYKGRYTNLVNHHGGIEREKSKLESLLVETQDKALRRISDLKEQCQLEQQAKSNLEDELRNDIEEKDHIINSLKTKIKFLQEKSPNVKGLENVEINENYHQNSKEDSALINLCNNLENERNGEVSLLTTENTKLKDKLQKMDDFLEEYKEMLEKNEEKIFEITNEKKIVERNYNILQKSSQEKLENMEIELNSSKKELERVKQDINILRKREEESTLSLAENKLSIHKELEGKEEKIKKLESEVKIMHKFKKSLEETLELQKQEIERVKILANQKAEESQQHLKVKLETLQQREELQHKLIDVEKEFSLKLNEEVKQNKELSLKVKVLKKQCEEQKFRENEYKTMNENLKREIAQLTTFKRNIEISISEIKTNYEQEIEILKDDLINKNNVCNDLNKEMQDYIETIEQFRQKLQNQNEEIKILEIRSSRHEDIFKLQEELENKKTDILGLCNELKSTSITINDLKNEMSGVVNHKNSLYKCLEMCKKFVKDLKQDCIILKKDVNSNLNNVKSATTEIIGEIVIVFSLINEKNNCLRFQLNDLHKKTSAMHELQNSCSNSNTQSEKIFDEKIILKKELAEKLSEIGEVKIKMSYLDKLETKNKSLTCDIENVTEKLSEVDEFAEETVNLTNALKSEKNNHYTVLEDIKQLQSELTSAKVEPDKRYIEVNKLQVQNRQQEQQYSVTRNERIEYKHLFEENSHKLSLLNKELGNSKIAIESLTTEWEKSKDSLQNALESKTHLLQKLEAFEEKFQKTVEEKKKAMANLEQEKLKVKTAEEQWNQSLNSMVEENERLKKKHQFFAGLEEELKVGKILIEALKIEKDKVTGRFEELKLECELLCNENKSLKDNQNDLLKVNNVFNQTQSDLMNRLQKLEKKNSDLIEERSITLQELETCRYKLKISDNELEKLKSQLERVKHKNNELSAFIDEAKEFELINSNLREQVKALTKTNDSLSLKIDILTKKLSSLQDRTVENEKLTIEVHNSKSKIVELEESLSSRVQGLSALSKNAQEDSHNFKIELEEKKRLLKVMKSKNTELLEEIEKLLSLKSRVEEKSTREIEELHKNFIHCETRLAEKNSLMEDLQKKCTELEREITNNIKHESNCEELSKNVECLMQEKIKLESQLDETLVTFQAKELQMQAFNDELRNKILESREQLKNNEDEQSLRLKQISKEFQAQLYDKEKELQAALKKKYDHRKNYESDTTQEYKNQLKDFQIELTKKSQQIVNLKVENEKLLKESQEEVKKLSAVINQIKSQHIKEMQEVDKKWKNFIHLKTNNLEIKHEQQVAELTTAWQNERKSDENSDVTDKELENTTRVAMATVQSNTSSFHTLQQTLLSQKRELAELRKLLKIRQESVEDSTEVKYLRNILFKYMMGKETMVLARVIAAVVKFDQDQTSKILKREEDRQSLLGSLGLT